MRRIVTAAIVGATVLAACSGPTIGPEPSTPDAQGATAAATPVFRPRTPNAAHALMPFAACGNLLDWTIEHAIDLVGPYGLYGDGYYPGPLFLDEVTTNFAAAESTDGAGIAAQGVIGTNLQELGIDEPDLVKTDGERIVVVTGSTLRVILIDGNRLSLAGSIDLGFWSENIFLDGDRVVVIAPSTGYYEIRPLTEDVAFETDLAGFYPNQTQKVMLTAIDISDPGHPELARSLQIDGRYISARMVAGAIRLVISSQPTGFAWSYPEGGGLRSERIAEEANREIIRESTIENWLPYYVVTDHVGVDRTVAEGTLLDCERTHRPEEFSGLNTLSLVTLDPDELLVGDATAVFADGEIVYSSGKAAYVATSRWISPVLWESGDQPADMQTLIHKFSLDPRSAEYEASGAVSGHLLSQWSMSEWQGDLRVASTTSPQWWDNPDSESLVSVLRDNGVELEVVGSVDGLGRGERIYAVRMIADRGYVVTFRQVDPLYVVDLSDPTRPTVEGELKIPGYSAYLHPIADGHLLGVGQDADEDGRVFGLQASLFDVSDPTDPHRTDRFTMKGGHSELEWDHHAFLFDPSNGLTVIPFQRWDERSEGPQAGAMVFEIQPDGIDEIGAVTHGTKAALGWDVPIRRSLLINGQLVTVSDAGVMLSDTDSLDTLDWVPFGG